MVLTRAMLRQSSQDTNNDTEAENEKEVQRKATKDVRKKGRSTKNPPKEIINEKEEEPLEAVEDDAKKTFTAKVQPPERKKTARGTRAAKNQHGHNEEVNDLDNDTPGRDIAKESPTKNSSDKDILPKETTHHSPPKNVHEGDALAESDDKDCDNGDDDIGDKEQSGDCLQEGVNDIVDDHRDRNDDAEKVSDVQQEVEKEARREEEVIKNDQQASEKEDNIKDAEEDNDSEKLSRKKKRKKDDRKAKKSRLVAETESTVMEIVEADKIDERLANVQELYMNFRDKEILARKEESRRHKPVSDGRIKKKHKKFKERA